MAVNAPDRDPAKQLVTAKMLVAMFETQITEYDGMNREQRRTTARGKDLTARIRGLHEGHAKWAARVTELEALIPTPTSPDGDTP